MQAQINSGYVWLHLFVTLSTLFRTIVQEYYFFLFYTPNKKIQASEVDFEISFSICPYGEGLYIYNTFKDHTSQIFFKLVLESFSRVDKEIISHT